MDALFLAYFCISTVLFIIMCVCNIKRDKELEYYKSKRTSRFVELVQELKHQHDIDVEKACEVFDRLMMDYEMERKSHDECLAEMRKAMEY